MARSGPSSEIRASSASIHSRVSSFVKDQTVDGMVIDDKGSDPMKIERDVVMGGGLAGWHRKLHAAMKGAALS